MNQLLRWSFAGLLLISGAFAFGESATTASVEKPGTDGGEHPALIPQKRSARAERFVQLHESFLERGKEGPIGVLFLGDSITERWTSFPQVWKRHFSEFQPANFGIGGDRTQHVLWRIANGELDGISPKVVVLLIGTNNANSDPPEVIAKAVRKIVAQIREKLPQSKILLMGVFPRAAKRDLPENKPMQRVREINKDIAGLDDGKTVRYLDIGEKFLKDGQVDPALMPDGVHLSEKGYEVWGGAIAPVLKEMLE